jgi:hypothetical protein
MKRPYGCDDSRELYERYYDRQQKREGEFPVYVGRYVQKGHGIGHIIGSLFRRILPGLKAIVPHVLRTGVNVLQDVSAGKSWKAAAIQRIPEGFSSFVSPEAAPIKGSGEQSGSGKRRKRRVKDVFG